MLRTTAGAAGYALLSASGCGGGSSRGTQSQEWPPSLPVGTFAPSAADNAFLDAMEQQGCLYFREQANPNNGQVLDHAGNNLGGAFDTSSTESSIAATGFGLTALCVADSRGYQPHDQILERVQTTLSFHLNQMPERNGFLYHFNDVNTGQPLAGANVSSMDMAIFLCGVLAASAWLGDPTVASLADQLYQRVNWPWMLNGASTFAQAWDPVNGFTPTRYDTYCELMMLYLLAMGSPTYPIAPSCWEAFARPTLEYEGYSYISSGSDPLFVHQYSHAWFDFRNKQDAYANYFNNSIAATQAHETFCLAYPSVQDAWYSEEYWGITSSDYVGGYTAWGGPPAFGPIDGTVVPCAAAGSLVFLPNQCLAMLEALKTNWGAAWGRYGFVDAFHPSANWYCPYVLGIDQGISVLMAENVRTGLIWKTFMSIPACAQAMELAGFQSSS
ncbi:MAG: glucoamylase family protein [Acidobacteriaceae bacterium]